MRKKEVSGDLSVQAIAGTHVVLLGMNLPKAKCPGLLGFVFGTARRRPIGAGGGQQRKRQKAPQVVPRHCK